MCVDPQRGISIEAAIRLVQATRDASFREPGEGIYCAPWLRPLLPQFAVVGYWELRADGTAYDWVVGRNSAGPWDPGAWIYPVGEET